MACKKASLFVCRTKAPSSSARRSAPPNALLPDWPAAPVERRALRRLRVRPLARPRAAVVHDDPRSRPFLGREDCMPPLGDLGIGPAKQGLRIPGREIHASVTFHVTEFGMPKGAVK